MEDAEQEKEVVKKIRLTDSGKKRGRPKKRKIRKSNRPRIPLTPRQVFRRRVALKSYENPERRTRAAEVCAKARAAWKGPTRLGVPDGWTREQANIQREFDAAKADSIMKKMTELGMIDKLNPDDFEAIEVIVSGKVQTVLVPKTDEAKGIAALREATIHALSPLTHAKDRATYIRTVLEYTKKKPESTSTINLNNEAWLDAALKDNASSNDGNDEGASSAS